MEDKSIRWYKSKVDWWLALLLAIPPVASIVVVGTTLRTGGPSDMVWGVGSVLLVAGIYLGLLFPMRYGIGSDRLTIRFGICRQHVVLADIREVRPTRNPLSSPALSLDRLHIQFGSRFFDAIMISPTPREQFLTDLGVSAGLLREGERLLRKESSNC